MHGSKCHTIEQQGRGINVPEEGRRIGIMSTEEVSALQSKEGVLVR